MKVVVAGTVAIDDIKTPKEERKGLMGGSASYAAMASSFFASTEIVGIIGKDFPKEHIDTPVSYTHLTLPTNREV